MKCFKMLAMVLVLVVMVLGSGQAVMAGQALLSWNANAEPDLNGYNIYYGTSSRDYGAPIPVDKNTTSFIVEDLNPEVDTVYYFAITAVDTSGNESGYSGEAQLTITDSVAPAPPTGLVAE